jgi:hypothetical protein
MRILAAVHDVMALAAQKCTEAIVCLDAHALAVLELVAVGSDDRSVIAPAVLALVVPRLIQNLAVSIIGHPVILQTG